MNIDKILLINTVFFLFSGLRHNYSDTPDGWFLRIILASLFLCTYCVRDAIKDYQKEKSDSYEKWADALDEKFGTLEKCQKFIQECENLNRSSHHEKNDETRD